MNALLALALLLPCAARADFKASVSAQVTGQVGVGTEIPQARFEVRMSSTDAYAVMVSSQDGAALAVVTKAGDFGVGTSSPQARLDVKGSGGSSDIGLQLRVGNSSSTTSSSQLVFASSTGTYRHSIRTRAVEGQNLYNAVDFFLWNSTSQPEALGSLHALSLQAVPYASTASVHVLPFGTPDVELEVSSMTVTGGGSMIRGSASAHSSRDLKTDIAYLNEDAEKQAYADVKALRPARFKYKGSSAVLKGLIYEDTPESVHGTGKTVVLDYRIANMELALKEANRRIRELEKRIAAREGR